MKFLVDAQLPRWLALRLNAASHDAIHTLDLPKQNYSSDRDLLIVAETEDRVVITKDADFVHSHLLSHRPAKLLLIATGNITNADLEALFIPLLPQIIAAFEANDFVELNRQVLIVRG